MVSSGSIAASSGDGCCTEWRRQGCQGRQP
jgi:hypothetical protein